MCTNQRRIINKYTGRDLWVSCGKCPACLQQKAAFRANRIRMNHKQGFVPYFITLTYDNFFVPYVKVQDLSLERIPIYRDYNITMAGVAQSELKRFAVRQFQPIGYIDNPDNNNYNEYRIKSLKHLPYKVGVCFYPDVQKFLKKLRINYERNFKTRLECSYFACSEYGGKSHRPHFHLLLYVPQNLGGWIRAAIAQAWTYGNRVPNGRYCEVARDAAGYVASYINSGNRLPVVLSLPETRQRHSYSLGFGTDNDTFSLSNILECLRKANLTYPAIRKSGSTTIRVDVEIPNYVINRFFPKFKGYSRLDVSQLREYIKNPSRLCEFRQSLDYSFEDIRAISIRLNHAFDYFHRVTGLNLDDYAIAHQEVWRLKNSDSLKNSLLGVKNWYQHYVNNPEYVFKNKANKDYAVKWSDVNSSLDSVAPDLSLFVFDPNSFTDVVVSTQKMEDLYNKMCKQKDVTNFAMIEQGIMV